MYLFYFCFTGFSFVYFLKPSSCTTINYLMIKTECLLDLKQMTLKREFCKLSLNAKNSNFNFCPVLPTFVQFCLLLPWHLTNVNTYISKCDRQNVFDSKTWRFPHLWRFNVLYNCRKIQSYRYILFIFMFATYVTDD